MESATTAAASVNTSCFAGAALPISDAHALIFVHIAKAGSSTIERSLEYSSRAYLVSAFIKKRICPDIPYSKSRTYRTFTYLDVELILLRGVPVPPRGLAPPPL